MVVAVTAPQLIAAAILNDVGPELTQEGLDRIRNYLGKDPRFTSWAEVAQVLETNNKGVPARYSQDDWVRMAKRVCRGSWRDPLRLRHGDRETVREQRRDAQHRHVAAIRRARAEALLVVRGEKSDLLSAEAVQKMQEAAPATRFAVIPGVGHAPDLDEPEAVAAIDDFLNSLA